MRLVHIVAGSGVAGFGTGPRSRRALPGGRTGAVVIKPVGRYAIEAPDGRRVYSDDLEQAEQLAEANRRAGCPVEVIDTEQGTGDRL